jgi:hypothetical protein
MSDIDPPPGVPKTIKGPNGETSFYVATRTTTPTTDTTPKVVIVKTCANRWFEVQKEAEAIVAPAGRLIADPRARNARINSAYAKLWLSDNRFQWAGLAAFASKQVGCGLLHASTLSQRAQQNARVAGADIGASIAYGGIESASQQMFELLALGNTTLFLDIYPLHLFYQRYGIERLRTCFRDRQNLAGKVLWPVDQKLLPFGYPFNEAVEGFEQIDQGRVTRSVYSFATHEQINVLQKIMYNRTDMQALLRANQAEWVIDMPSGIAADIQLTLSAQCSPVSGMTESFPRTMSANLAEPDQRMSFVKRAADRFDALLHGSQRPQVERSIQAIGSGGGIS